MNKKIIIHLLLIMILASCNTDNQKNSSFDGSEGEVQLMIIDPGHFHAALVLKKMYPQVNPKVNVYGPDGPDITDHLKLIDGFNNRQDNPTQWVTRVYTGEDFLHKMIEENAGNVMITAGNNEKKTEYIMACVESGFNVLADKPMAIDLADFELLKEAFAVAKKNHVLLYDIMTERYEINSILQKEFSQVPQIFGNIESGSIDNPAVTKESVHHYFKYVSGNEIKRPPWFFDVTKEGDGIVDVTTHLVDLVQWECFPGEVIDYTRDIEMLKAKRWATELTLSQFNRVTRLSAFPDYLVKDIHDSILNVFCNGEMIYKIRDIHAKVSVQWNYKAPEGSGDTHFSIMRGSKANLVIRQGAEQDFKATLYIEPVDLSNIDSFKEDLDANFGQVADKYPGLELKKHADKWEVLVPDKYKTGHEEHFAQVMEKYLSFLKDGNLPEWEVPNMIAKYYTTTKALELAKSNN